MTYGRFIILGRKKLEDSSILELIIAIPNFGDFIPLASSAFAVHPSRPDDEFEFHDETMLERGKVVWRRFLDTLD